MVVVDLSAAVYVAAANVCHGRGAVFARADALALPTAPASFRTFDALSAKYDLPQTKDDVVRWRDASAFERFSVTDGANGLVINAVAAR